MGDIHPDTRPRTPQRTLFLALVAVLALCIPLLLAGPAGAGPLTGGFSPTIVGGGADLDGNGIVNGSDDANAFYGDTSIIDGKLDCDAWGAVANQGDAGNGSITLADNCSLVGYDGTPDGVTIDVVNGFFQVGDGPLPTVFNAGNPDNADIGDSDFAWSAIDGRVDSNGNEDIDSDDCHAGLIPLIDVLSNDNSDSNPCGFASSPNTSDNGLLDFNNDQDVTGADSCSNGCFFGLDVDNGKVQEVECAGFKAIRDTTSSARPVTTRSSARQAATSSADEAVTTRWSGPARTISSSAVPVQTSPVVEAAATSYEEGPVATGSSVETPAIASSATAAMIA